MKLYQKILIGMVGGVVTGLGLRAFPSPTLLQIAGGLRPLGEIFIDLITMVVIPLVFASLLIGTASLGDLRKIGRIGGKTVLYYLCTTAIAVTIGLFVANVVKPGNRLDPGTRDAIVADISSTQVTQRLEDSSAAQPPQRLVVDLIKRVIPRNPVKAASEFNLLGIIFFSVLFGAAISALKGEQKEVVLHFFGGINQACMILIGWIMHLAPYAVFFLIVPVITDFGAGILGSLIIYMFTVLAGLLLHSAFTYGLSLRFLAKLGPVQFLRAAREPQLMGFTTSSSSATLPLTMEKAEQELGISRGTSSFVLPLGATINMDGTALYQAVAVVFIANVYGVDLSWAAQISIVLTATMASIGAAGVPAAGLITLVIVLNAAGLADLITAGIALILGVDRILDMCRTAVNITGDMTAAAVVARSEGETLAEPAHRPTGKPPAIVVKGQ